MSGSTKEEVFQKTKDGEWGFEKMDWNPISIPAKDLIWALLSVDPKTRPSAKNALKHDWFSMNDYKDDEKNEKIDLHDEKKEKKEKKEKGDGTQKRSSTTRGRPGPPIYHLSLTRSKNRLKRFNSKRKLKTAAFAALTSSRRRNSLLNRSTNNNNSLKDQVRSMKPSPSCPDLASLRASASNDNLLLLASGMPSDAYKTPTTQRNIFQVKNLATWQQQQQQKQQKMPSPSNDTNTNEVKDSSSHQQHSRTSSNDVNQHSSNGLTRSGGMSRSHTVGESLASIVNHPEAIMSSIISNSSSNGSNGETILRRHSSRMDEMRGSFGRCETITESSETGSYINKSSFSSATSIGESLPRFTPGSLSTYSKNEVAKIKNYTVQEQQERQRQQRQQQQEQQQQQEEQQEEEEDIQGVEEVLGTSYDSHDSPLGF